MVNTYNSYELSQTQKLKLLDIPRAYSKETQRPYRKVRTFFIMGNLTDQIFWSVSKFWNLHETTEAMGFMRSLFHYSTQITFMENGDHTIWMYYNQQKKRILHETTEEIGFFW